MYLCDLRRQGSQGISLAAKLGLWEVYPTPAKSRYLNRAPNKPNQASLAKSLELCKPRSWMS